MAEIVPLRPSEHDAVQQLLPWHVNGTLSAEETARVEAHLAECEDCRHDLACERELAREVALLDAARAAIGDAGGASAWRVGGTGKLLARLVAEDGYALRKRLIPLLERDFAGGGEPAASTAH